MLLSPRSVTKITSSGKQPGVPGAPSQVRGRGPVTTATDMGCLKAPAVSVAGTPMAAFGNASPNAPGAYTVTTGGAAACNALSLPALFTTNRKPNWSNDMPI